jgi:proteasome inhibitor subunit 1 (PI31)
MSDLLDPQALLLLLPTLLPNSTSSPLPNPTDALAALVHTIHTTLGFRLVTPVEAPSMQNAAATREREIGDTASETETAVEDEDAGEGDGGIGGSLPQGWNARGEDSYIFEYRHPQSAMVFRVRVGRMGGRVQIDGMAEVSLLDQTGENARYT